MPKTGTPRRRSAAHARRPRRRPRPGRRGRSRGRRRRASRASTSAAGVDAGTTSTWQPARDEVAQDRALDAEVVGDDVERRVGVADRVRLVGGDVGDEVDAVGRRAAAAAATRTAASSVPNAPGIAPCSRRWRVRRRVSMPAIAGHAVPGAGTRRATRSARQLLVAAGEVAHDHARAERRGGSRRRRRSRRSCRCAGR